MTTDEDSGKTKESLSSLFAREDKARARARRLKPPSEERSYPLMRSLLEDPDSVGYGLEQERPAAGPGALFPKKKAPEQRSAAPVLDEMLSSMADGVLIGGSDKRSEMRISLSDEFFGGTELQIAIEDGQVHARFAPPDNRTFSELEGRIDELRAWLEERGLRVGAIDLVKP